MYSSVKGGNTANTEFEFLTGLSMYFLPTGSIPYQQYIKSEVPSLASQLSSVGYTSVSMHPYYPKGWNRDTEPISVIGPRIRRLSVVMKRSLLTRGYLCLM